jgi:hypothetical protein
VYDTLITMYHAGRVDAASCINVCLSVTAAENLPPYAAATVSAFIATLPVDANGYVVLEASTK